MRKKNDTLTTRQRVALGSLLSGKNRQQAADDAGIHVATLYKWLAEDVNFQAELHKNQTALYEQMVSQLFNLSEKAVKALERNAECGHPPTETRAALGMAALIVRMRNDDVTVRLNKLERLLEDKYELEFE